jgi:hypothetical protein
MEVTIPSMLLRKPPGVFISMTIAAAPWLWAVETTRAIKASEPGSTATLNSATTTGCPDV